MRKQFTFYSSFYRALRMITDPMERLAVYDIICEYALEETVPELSGASLPVRMAFELIQPTLDSSLRKSEAGKKGAEATNTMKRQTANARQTASEGEKEKEYEYEYESEKEIESEYEYEGEKDTFFSSPAAVELMEEELAEERRKIREACERLRRMDGR